MDVEIEMKRWIGALALMAATTTGCDDGPTGPVVEEGSFSIQITGAMNETATGPAFFGSEDVPGEEPVWAVLLGEQDGRHVVVAGKPGAARPGVGTYSLVDGNGPATGWTLAHFVGDGEELLGSFVAESGNVTITVSTASEVRGTLQFRAVGLLGANPGAIDVTGSFSAVAATGALSSASPLGAAR